MPAGRKAPVASKLNLQAFNEAKQKQEQAILEKNAQLKQLSGENERLSKQIQAAKKRKRRLQARVSAGTPISHSKHINLTQHNTGVSQLHIGKQKSLHAKLLYTGWCSLSLIK